MVYDPVFPQTTQIRGAPLNSNSGRANLILEHFDLICLIAFHDPAIDLC